MMDNFHSLFPFQQDDNNDHQLLYPPTNNNSSSSFLYYQEDNIQLQDLVTDLTPVHSLEVETNNVHVNNTNTTNKINKRGKKSQNSSSAVSLQVDENTADCKQKKIIHREIERQRRQEMSNLYASLRQLLPLEYLKGKRSTSDHILEAVNYIDHLQKKVRNLEDNRDKLKEALSSSDVDYHKSGRSSSSHESSAAAIITLRPCLDGMEILTDCSVTNEGFHISRVLEVLLREGLSIVSCSCNKVNGRLLHTIRTEVCSPSSIDAYKLQQKLAATVNSN